MFANICYTQDEFGSLRDEWDELLRNSDADSIFLTWDWISSWLEVRKSPVSLFVINVRDEGGELIGVAPFYKAKYRLLNTLPVSVFRVLGDTSSGAEYGNFMIRRGASHAVSVVIGQALLDSRGDWDAIWLPNVASWAPSFTSLKKVLATKGLTHRRRARSFSAASLPASSDEFMAALSSSSRKNVRRNYKKVFAQEGASFDLVTDPNELQNRLDTLFVLHGMRRQLLDDCGSFEKSSELTDFYRSFAPKALAQNYLRMAVLTISDEPAAIQYGFRYGDTYMQLQEGFNPDKVNGLGTALRKASVDALINEGVTEYDFLGGHTEHKRRWGAEERFGCDLIVCHNWLFSSALYRSGIWPTGKYLGAGEP